MDFNCIKISDKNEKSDKKHLSSNQVPINKLSQII